MVEARLLDSAGRRRSPASMPGYHLGRIPRTKGQRYPADPPRTEEIVAVMRHSGENLHGDRVRALIVLLWRAGPTHPGSAVADRARPRSTSRFGPRAVRQGRPPARDRHGRLGLRTRPTLARSPPEDAGRPAVLRVGRPHARARVVRGRGPGGALPTCGPCGRPAPLRAPSAPARTCDRARARGRAAEHHPTPARPPEPRRDLHLPARHRPGEIIATIHARRPPMIPASAGLDLRRR